MHHTFTKDIYVECIVASKSTELLAIIQFSTTPYDPGVSSGPVEKCYPPEGGEIEDKEATLFFPAETNPGAEFHAPALAKWIIENVSDDVLLKDIDWYADQE
jgi:hypothetical protein